MKKCSLLFLVLLLSLATVSLYGQVDGLTPVTRPYAFRNAHIVAAPGKVIDRGTVVIKDGLILAAGKEVSIPYDARVYDADSMYVYAGFIDGLSHAGLKKEKREEENQQRRGRPEGVDPGNPPAAVAGIQPQRRVSELLDPKDGDLKALRQLGFTAAHVVPEEGMLPGYGALILLAGDDGESMVFRDKASLFSQLQSARGVYPATVIGVMSKYRELYAQAGQAMKHEALYAKDPGGMARPVYDMELQAFYPVINGELPVFFKAADAKSVYRVYALQDDLGFPLVLAGVKEGWHLAEKIKTGKTPVFLSLDLPEDKGEKEEKEERKGGAKEGEKPGKPGQEAQKEMSEEMKKLEARRVEFLKKFESQAAVFSRHDIPFGFTTSGAKIKDVRANLRRMIANGLSEDAALAALTTMPAGILGLDKMMGTVEKGKIANLVVTDKPYFDEKSAVRYVVVDGKVFEYEKEAPGKASDPESIAIAGGTWDYKIDVPGQTMAGTLVLSENNGVLEGTISNPQTGGEDRVEEGVAEGNEVRFVTRFQVDGQMITVRWVFEISGDTFDGSVNAGEFGTFDISGERVGRPGGGR